mmetsp:Transcript_23372/g.34356  ORF Transcript_23372/g.34356 Transcript_23372/m.34356 type:complete len:212 (-) Transcript_23372:70-705(-)
MSEDCRMNHEENSSVRKKIEAIYKEHNPEKLAELDTLMAKCTGKEHLLLKKIQDKYIHKSAGQDKVQGKGQKKGQKKNHKKPWVFILKNYAKDDKFHNKEIENGLEDFMKILGGLADSIGGECAKVVNKKNGHRQLVVRQVIGRDDDGHDDVATIMPTIEHMRQVIHKRYEHNRKGQSVAHLHTDEHERRKEEKRSDLLKKKSREKSRKRY